MSKDKIIYDDIIIDDDWALIDDDWSLIDDDLAVVDDDWATRDDDFATYDNCDSIIDDDFLLYGEDEGMTSEEIKELNLEEKLWEVIKIQIIKRLGYDNWYNSCKRDSCIKYLISLSYEKNT